MENKKTIKELMNAAELSDGDFLAVNQPNVNNPITQQPGDTRRVTIGQLAAYTNKSVGKLEFWDVELSPYEQAKRRLMPLNYQIIEIDMYPELCAKKWCGAENNATALFWYKCDADGTRNVDGLYMRVEDSRGMFYRVAGQNAILKAANNTPYDGKLIGSFNPDTFQGHGHTMRFSSEGVADGTNTVRRITNGGSNNSFSVSDAVQLPNVYDYGYSPYGTPRFNYETAGAWLAIAVYISY